MTISSDIVHSIEKGLITVPVIYVYRLVEKYVWEGVRNAVIHKLSKRWPNITKNRFIKVMMSTD